MPEFFSEKSRQDTPEQRAFELKRRAFHLMRSYVERNWNESPVVDRKSEFIKKITTGAKKLIPEGEVEIGERLNLLNNEDETNLDSFFDKATEAIIEIMTRYASLEELEKRFSARSVNERGNQALSRALHFAVHLESNTISLHIPITFFENPVQFLESFTEGLKILAQKIITDPEFKNILEVTGHSALVKDKHRLLKSMGFEIILDENGKPTQYTKISKDKLLELYGPK